ncbi:MAG TPA: hypothetical protein VLH39_03155, partial [Magnetospirillaceae bacterium]|nr:hypothetical protein [Magnetospirillaceae bacterium]
MNRALPWLRPTRWARAVVLLPVLLIGLALSPYAAAQAVDPVRAALAARASAPDFPARLAEAIDGAASLGEALRLLEEFLPGIP